MPFFIRLTDCRTLLAMLCCVGILSGCSGSVASHDEAVRGIRGDDAVSKKGPADFAADQINNDAFAGTYVDDGWLKSFNDAELDKLAAEALADNPGIKISKAQVDQAEAKSRQAGAALKPAVNLGGGFSDRNHSALTDIAAGVINVSWEPDVWGRVGAGVASAKEMARASKQDYRFARMSLVATVANSWFLAIESKLQHQFAGEVKAIKEKNYELVQARFKVGRVDKHEVALAKSEVAKAEEAEVHAKSALEDSARSLELLLGRYPSAELEITDKLKAVPPPFPAGIPSEIMERRPDLVAAENRVAAAFQKEKEAKLLHLPSFRFSLGLGANSLNNSIAGLAAGVFAPLYTGGAIEAEVEQATAVQKEAINAYAQAALNAFKEVESALAAEEYLAEREKYMQEEVKDKHEAYTLMMAQYKVGKISLVDTLTVQTQWVDAQISLIDLKTLRLSNRIKLHLALGGSFE